MTDIVASAARTSSGVSTQIELPPVVRHGTFDLNVTAAATAAGDTLNVYLQTSPDGGTTWDDFISYTQVLGNGGVKRFVAFWNSNIVPATALRAMTDGSLAAGSVLQGPIVGSSLRAKWTIVSASSPSFTFSIKARLTQQ